jgi:hypothetical protein
MKQVIYFGAQITHANFRKNISYASDESRVPNDFKYEIVLRHIRVHSLAQNDNIVLVE